MNIPRWAKLSKREKEYWKLWEPEFTKMGTLTSSTLPEFIGLIRCVARRDVFDDFIQTENPSCLETRKYVDSAGQEHTSFEESKYSKLSRDYNRLINMHMKIFRPKPKAKDDKKKKDDILD